MRAKKKIMNEVSIDVCQYVNMTTGQITGYVNVCIPANNLEGYTLDDSEADSEKALWKQTAETVKKYVRKGYCVNVRLMTWDD
jgi:hypothetical protein